MIEFSEFQNYIIEINCAEAARAVGNEGKARVCARRAAGILIGEYMRRRDYALPSISAYDRLRFLSQHKETPAKIRDIVSHFLVRIDTDQKLPIEADLIEDARTLKILLLNDVAQNSSTNPE